MAYALAVLVSLEQTIHQFQNQDRYSTSTKVKHHIASLDKYVISFQAFLEGFPGKSKKLEARIGDAATAAENIIECFMLDQIQSIDEPAAGVNFLYKLNVVAKMMEEIAAEVAETKNSVMIKDEKLSDSSVVSSSSTVLPSGETMVGFDDDLLVIKGRLVEESTSTLQHIAISGMGGIGKTTLARNAYEDQLIQDHFDIRAWVTISQDYRAQEILSGLLDSLKEFNPNGSKGSVTEMADRIRKILYCRRYLIVMDDIWSTEVLDNVRNMFPDNGNRSRIMLTTRLSDVAAYADTSPHKMCLMDEKMSWNLLKQKISKDNLSDELKRIGHEIATSCRGLPLAVVVIAGILSCTGETPDSWAEVSKNIKKATSKDNRVEEIVSLGYNHLPHRLRPCLLYMALLPEDYNIRASLLVKLWIAEGFLKHPDDSSKSLEADAEEHLEDLVRRNLILVKERKYNGKIKSCSLHDMVRETCIRMLEEEKYLRHVTTDIDSDTRKDNQGCISKRSVLCFGHDKIDECTLERFRLLRVLHAYASFEVDTIKKLYHLRYLSVKGFMRFTADISGFQNLQSLIIRSDIYLPSSIWKLRQLRHLIVRRGWLPAPFEALPLENLKTLKKLAHDPRNEPYLFQRVPKLIKLGLFLTPHEVRFNESLVCLRQLEELKICFEYRRPQLFSAVFPNGLKKCTLEGGIASVSFLEAIGSLPNLEVLRLRKCAFDSDTWEVRGGVFPNLKILQLSGIRSLRTFIVEDSNAFPMLNFLHIDNCWSLVELSDEIGDIPTLELIKVSSTKEDVYDWARRIEEDQKSLGNETLQVRYIRPILFG